MRYLEHRPSNALSEAVECLWTLEGDGVADTDDRVPPDGTIEIVVHFSRPFAQARGAAWSEQPAAFVVGPMSRCLVLRPSADARVLGLRLRGPAAASLLEVHLRDLADQIVPLDDLPGRPLLDELQAEGWDDARSVAARAEDALRRRRPSIEEPGRLALAALGRLFASRGRIRTSDLAAELGVGERRLQRAFDATIGLTPKRVARIARLQTVLRRLSSPVHSLADVAAECGYADQSHFTNEVRQLTGVSPTAFLRERHALAELFSGGERTEALLSPAGPSPSSSSSSA